MYVNIILTGYEDNSIHTSNGQRFFIFAVNNEKYIKN
jgi:hypothetical protein